MESVRLRAFGLCVLLAATTFALAGTPSQAGFHTVLREWEADQPVGNMALVRLQADEDYGNYFFRLDAGDPMAEATAGHLVIRRVATSDVICDGVLGEVMEVHVHRDCDGLRALHFYELTWDTARPGDVLSLLAY